jgi:hypothetical protein
MIAILQAHVLKSQYPAAFYSIAIHHNTNTARNSNNNNKNEKTKTNTNNNNKNEKNRIFTSVLIESTIVPPTTHQNTNTAR